MKRLFIIIILVAGMAALVISVSADDPGRVVSCLGDSITEGIPYSGTGNTYPARLQAMLDATYGAGSFEVINHGVGGWRADQVRDHTQGWMAEDNPDYVLLLVGGNDLAQLQSIESTVAEVQAIVDLVTAHTNPDDSHPRIIVSAILPNLISELATWWVSVYNDSLESDLTGVDLWFTDNWDDFYDPATGQADASLMADLVHSNAEGYMVMAENWLEVLDPLLPTPTNTPTATSTPTPTDTPANTPTSTPTSTPTKTTTPTDTPTSTPTHTPTPTNTPTNTPTLTTTPTPTPTYSCDLPGDLNCDCDVDIADIMLVAGRWHTAEGDEDYDPAYDLDDNGDIDIVDIMLVAVHWGESCES